MGMNEAPFGPIGMKICRATPPSRAFARGKGFRVPGGWGVGKKLKNVSFSGHFFLGFWEGCHGTWGLGLWEKVEKCDMFLQLF